VTVEDLVEAHLERAVEHLSAVKHGQIPDHRVDAHLVKKTPGTSTPRPETSACSSYVNCAHDFVHLCHNKLACSFS
jgi:hypothetical protein